MSLIVSLETSTNVCSVALFHEQTLLACSEVMVQKSHSSLLTVMIRQCVEQSGYQLKDLNAIALSQGPGSYTGLRIGSSVAKGLCYSLGIPLIAVDTLHALARHISHLNYSKALLCPMLDARRMEVYCSIIGGDGEVILASTPKILDETSFDEVLENKDVIFFGNGSDKFIPLKGNHPKAHFVRGTNTSARGVGLIAYDKFNSNNFENLIYFEPNYLKEFVSSSKPKK